MSSKKIGIILFPPKKRKKASVLVEFSVFLFDKIIERMSIKSVVHILLSLFIVSLIACTSEQRKSLEPIPVAIGTTNEIVVVADQAVWDGPVGDSVRYYFEAPYILLPQPEPMFDLRHFTMKELRQEPLRKQLRTYLLLGDLQDEDSVTSKEIRGDLRAENIRRAKEDASFSSTAGRNKWAQGQLLIYLFGYGQEALIDNVRKNFPIIAQKVNNFDIEQVDASAYVMGSNDVLTGKIREKLGFTINVPSDYKLAIEDGNFMWLRKETRQLSSNIMLYKIPYTDKAQLTKDGIKAIRNELGEKYITTDIEGAFMQINDEDLPLFVENVRVNGQFGIEARGIWDIENDFMGGPFLSYLILNPDTNELLFIDGFVHAPSKGKRDFMQQLAYVLKSVKF